MNPEPALYLGVLKTAMPVPAPSCTDTEICSGCGGEIWCDPKSRALVAVMSGGHFVYLCMECFERQETS